VYQLAKTICVFSCWIFFVHRDSIARIARRSLNNRFDLARSIRLLVWTRYWIISLPVECGQSAGIIRFSFKMRFYKVDRGRSLLMQFCIIIRIIQNLRESIDRRCLIGVYITCAVIGAWQHNYQSIGNRRVGKDDDKDEEYPFDLWYPVPSRKSQTGHSWWHLRWRADSYVRSFAEN